jgi:hypothetical protein
VAMDQRRGPKTVPVFGVFRSGTALVDAYSGATGTVRHDSVSLASDNSLVLLGEAPRVPEDTVVVYVTNNWGLPMDVFAIGSGTTYRMGTVSPGIPRRFVLRRDVLVTNGEVEFLARANGSGPQVRSGVVQLRAGDVAVDFVIMTNLIGSRATIRP